MRTRASVILGAFALTQLIVLGAATAFLALKLRDLRADLTRLGHEEQGFLSHLADVEGDLYRTSILLRDNIILEGAAQNEARRELSDLLGRISEEDLRKPSWVPPGTLVQMTELDAARSEYVTRARTVLSWKEHDRQVQGPAFLSQQLAPMREKFVVTARELETFIRSLRLSRNRATADSIAGIQLFVIRILTGAAVFGLVLASIAIRRFRNYEQERDVHIQNLRQAEGGLRALSLRLVQSQELERKKLSRELHDEVGQILTALRVQLGQIDPVSEPSQACLARASELAERSLRTVRDMARGLRPAMLDDLGLAPALKWLGRDFSRNTVLDVDVQIEGELSGLDEARRTCLYRVVQEALTNCVKHSGSNQARVMIHESPLEIVVTVQDGGSGFAPGSGKGIGLLGMRERVEELGGQFDVISSPGSGTLIRANLPKKMKDTKATA